MVCGYFNQIKMLLLRSIRSRPKSPISTQVQTTEKLLKTLRTFKFRFSRRTVWKVR